MSVFLLLEQGNPALLATEHEMKVFGAVLWRAGHFMRFSAYLVDLLQR